MYHGVLEIYEQPFINNSRRIATPVLGFLSSKCYAAPITRKSIYLCVSHTEALLMASDTSYLSIYRVASALLCYIQASFVTCEHLAILVPNLRGEGSTLLCLN
jgi:hypothetical protein